MAVTTANDVVNVALDHLHEAVVANYLTGTDAASKAARRFFEHCRDAVLREYPWGFATRISSTLTASSDAADDDWNYKYALPTGCLRVLAVFDADRAATDSEFAIRHTPTQNINVLVTDIETAKIKFIFQETAVTAWGPTFIDALAYRLAADLAGPVTGNVQLKQGMLQFYQWALSRAKQMDASEQRLDRLNDLNQGFIDARA